MLQESRHKFHILSIDDVLAKLKTSRQGLSSSQSKLIRAQTGPNRIDPPNKCPQWLCCLLSLRSETLKREIFEDCVPESAKVLRDGRFILVDSNCLVMGDIVRVGEDESVPADIRIIEVRLFCVI